MENDELEVIGSQDDTQNETVDTNEVQLTVDDYNKLKAEKEALEEKNKKLYARLNKKPSENKPLVNTDNSQVTQELAVLKLKVNHGISDPEAIDFIMKNGGEKALENPYIKGTIDTMLSQKKSEQAVVADDSGYSVMDKKYTNEQLKAMSSEELEKLLPHA